MATKKSITDKKTTRSFLNQLIDVLQEDISSSVSRRKYQVFVTGGIGPGVTSSLFQTVYDQDFTLQTANPVFDITFGLAPADSYRSGDSGTQNSSGIAGTVSTGTDAGGKYLYPSSSLMMREKTDIYGQFAQTLLGNRSRMFQLPNDATFTSTQSTNPIDAALFVAYKRLFARDQIKRETFAMRFYQTASTDFNKANIGISSLSGSAIYTDIGSSEGRYFETGGQYGYIVDASQTTRAVGLMYYDSGIAVLDLEKITDKTQRISGTISSMSPLGQEVVSSSFIPHFVSSASIDAVVDHLCFSRFGSGSLTSMTFQNVTNINSSIVFCRAEPDDFNYSSNPTYVEQSGQNIGRLTIYDSTQDDTQETFTYVTTIGLLDSSGGLLAVAKLSRPVEKNASRDLTFRVRLDFAKKKSLSTTK